MESVAQVKCFAKMSESPFCTAVERYSLARLHPWQLPLHNNVMWLRVGTNLNDTIFKGVQPPNVHFLFLWPAVSASSPVLTHARTVLRVSAALKRQVGYHHSSVETRKCSESNENIVEVPTWNLIRYVTDAKRLSSVIVQSKIYTSEGAFALSTTIYSPSAYSDVQWITAGMQKWTVDTVHRRRFAPVCQCECIVILLTSQYVWERNTLKIINRSADQLVSYFGRRKPLCFVCLFRLKILQRLRERRLAINK